MTEIERLRAALKVFAPGAANTTAAEIELLRASELAFYCAEIGEAAAILDARGTVTSAALAMIETPAIRIQREGEDLLVAFDKAGGGREAPMIIARRLAPGKPHQQHVIAQRIRALSRRRRKKTQPLRLPG
jgi:hypothetical protein